MDPASFVQLSAPVTVLRTPTEDTYTIQKRIFRAVETYYQNLDYVSQLFLPLKYRNQKHLSISRDL